MGIFLAPKISETDRLTLVLEDGEIVYDTDQKIFYKGDGVTSGGVAMEGNSDWNATSGAAEILNKPSTFPPSSHTHTASEITDFTAAVNSNSNVSANTSARHTHSNKALLDTYTQTNADIADAVTRKHSHVNFSILELITAAFTTALKTDYDSAVSWISTNSTNLLNHLSNTSNPHSVTKSQVGLGNVDNTSDLNKPVSTATQTALNTKLNVGSTTADINDSLNRRYVTDSQLTTINNTSNTNTGDETNTTIKTKLGQANSTNDGYLSSADWTSFDSKQDELQSGVNIKTVNGESLLGASNIVIPVLNTISADLIVDFENEQNQVLTLVPNAQITTTNFVSFTYFPIETLETSLDDFTLNAVSFNIEQIVNNTSFTIRGTALNGASGNYTIKYIITYI